MTVRVSLAGVEPLAGEAVEGGGVATARDAPQRRGRGGAHSTAEQEGAFWRAPPREMLCYVMPCCAMRWRSLPWPARGDTRPRVPSGAQMNTRRAHFSSSRAALRRLRKQLYRAQLLLDVLLRRERLKHQLAMMQQAIELIK